MKKLMLLFIVLLLMPVVSAGQNNPLKISRIMTADPVYAGDPLHVMIALKGIGTKKSKDVKVRATLFDMATMDSDGPNDIGTSKRTANLLLDTHKDASSGWYLMRVSVHDSKGNRRTKHRFVWVE